MAEATPHPQSTPASVEDEEVGAIDVDVKSIDTESNCLHSQPLSLEIAKPHAAPNQKHNDRAELASVPKSSSISPADVTKGSLRTTAESVINSLVAKCMMCAKTVYPVEMLRIDSQVIHKSCLRCGHCKNLLKLGNYASLNGKFYCKPHFKQLFALKGNYSDGFKSEDSPVALSYVNNARLKLSEGSPRDSPAANIHFLSGDARGGGNGKSLHDSGSMSSLNQLHEACGVCDKVVYPVDRVKIDDQILHAGCFRCSQCRSKLKLSNFASSNGKFFCQPHFASSESHKPVILGTASELYRSHSKLGIQSLSRNNLSTPSTPSAATQPSSHDHSSVPNSPIPSARNHMEPSDENARQATHKNTQHHPTSNLASSNTNHATSPTIVNLVSEVAGGRLPGMGVSRSGSSGKIMSFTSPECPVCTKSVYPVDKITIDDKILHRACLRCAHCNSMLKLGNYAALDGKYFCKPHFKQLFALKGNYNDGFGSRPHKEKWLAAAIENVKQQ